MKSLYIQVLFLLALFPVIRVDSLVSPYRPCAKPASHRSQRHVFRQRFDHYPVSEGTNNNNHLDWVNFGMSWVYLAHFSSLYVQLPGLVGSTGLSPIADRISNLENELWALQYVPSPEAGLEFFCFLGMLVSLLQIVEPKVRCGVWPGVFAYALNWILWHDLLVAGGRFTEYQMDLLVIDAAPLTLLAAVATTPSLQETAQSLSSAATFGCRWLLARLYIGAGAIKLLTCDPSWRNLSAIHWHFQSQPLPNLVGAGAYKHLPDAVTHPLTWAVLVIEMAAPFLFLAPSREIRRFAFVCNILLMVGIGLFGDFGSLQVLLIVIGFALLDDLPPAPGIGTHSDGRSVSLEESQNAVELSPSSQATRQPIEDALSIISVLFAASGAYWAMADLGSCHDTLPVAPLGICLVVLGTAISISQVATSGPAASILSLFLLSGSVVPLASSLYLTLPPEWADALNSLNLGSVPYRLFGSMTGLSGRPVAAIEGAYSSDGPWTHVPLLYQINDPSAPPPFCFPHFPRFDWTLWFVPLGDSGAWIEKLLQGIIIGDRAIVDGLLDGPSFHDAFPDGPPSFVRIVPKLYELQPDLSWLASEDPASPMPGGVFSRERLLQELQNSDVHPWPSTPIVRKMAESTRPEYFIWGLLGATEASRRILSAPSQSLSSNDTEV